jgi:hypothetical protein
MNTRVLILGYGSMAYLTFPAAFVYAIGFVGNIGVPRSVDNSIAASLGEALAVNLALLGLFAVHSVVARPGFKRWWTRFVAPSVERSTYVLIASDHDPQRRRPGEDRPRQRGTAASHLKHKPAVK